MVKSLISPSRALRRTIDHPLSIPTGLNLRCNSNHSKSIATKSSKTSSSSPSSNHQYQYHHHHQQQQQQSINSASNPSRRSFSSFSLSTRSSTSSPLQLLLLSSSSSTSLVQTRSYSRDPRQAEHEANTVRGHRTERARNEKLRAKASEEESARASPSLSASGSASASASTHSSKSHQGPHGSQGDNQGGNKNKESKEDSLFSKLAQTWRTTPTKWYPIPVLLGAFVLIGIQARRNYNQDKNALENGGRTRGGKIVDENGHVVTMKGPWTVYVIGALPLNAISRTWGWANNLTLPVWFRPFGFKLYARIFGCNLDEMKDPDLTHYKSLGEFFYRELKDGVRPMAPTTLVSPADGKVLHFGSIEGRRVEQVKGITYSLDALLGTSSPAESTESLDLPSTSGSSKNSSDEEVLDEERFANVNGIEYSLDSLLGNDRRKSKRWHGPLGINRVAHWSWWKSWVVRPGKGINTTGVPPPASGREIIPEKPSSSNSSNNHNDNSEEEGEEVEAGMPTPDTPEVLGRYANVAYEMGSSALPPILQPHSPGHEGLREGNKLFFCVVYLAPGDYHRFHSPASWIVERRRHFRGELYSVSPYMASRLSNLFVLNERVALLGRWRYGFFGMVPVGATNVGSIRINFDRALRTNVRDQRALAGTYSEASYGSASRLLGGQPLLVGTEMGGFLLGSTIVLVFEAPENFKFEVEPGAKIKVGEKLGNVVE